MAGRGALLLVMAFGAAVLTGSASAEPASPRWFVEDAAGDMVANNVIPGVPQTGTNRHVDISGLSIQEPDRENLLFDLLLHDLQVGTPQPQGQSDQMRATIGFTHDPTGSPIVLRIDVRGFLERPASPSQFVAHEASATACITPARCTEVPVSLRDAENSISVTLPKESLLELLGHADPEGTEDPHIFPGDGLMGVFASTNYYASYAAAVQISDHLPEGMEPLPPYEMFWGTEADPLDLRLARGHRAWLIHDGDENRIPAEFRNRLDASITLELTYIVATESGTTLPVQLAGPPTIVLGPNQNATIHLFADAIAAHAADGPLRLTVSAHSREHSATIQDDVVLMLVQALGPDQPDLRVVSRVPFDMAQPDGIYNCLGVVRDCRYGFMSFQDQSETAAPEGYVAGRSYTGAGGTTSVQYSIFTDLPITRPVFFDRAGRIDVHVEFENAGVAEGVRVQATLAVVQLEGEEYLLEEEIFNGSATGSSAIDLSGPPRFSRYEEPLLDEGTHLRLRVFLEYPVTSSGAAQTIQAPRMLPYVSTVRLPLVPVPQYLLASSGGSALQVTEVIADSYLIAPGGKRSVTVQWFNQAATSTEVDFRAEAPEGWTAAFDTPSGSMAPGEFVRTGVTIQAPAQAREDETAYIRLAAEPRDGSGRAEMPIRFVVSQASESQPNGDAPESTRRTDSIGLAGLSVGILAAVGSLWSRRR